MVGSRFKPTSPRAASRRRLHALLLVALVAASALPTVAALAPTAQRVSPSGGSVTLSIGQSQSFDGQCVNPDRDLDRAEYWQRNPGSSSYSLMDTDSVQWQADPWGAHAWSASFSTAGTGYVRFTCVDETGESHSTEWTVTVQAAANTFPTAQRVAPAQSSVTLAIGQSQSFDGQCANPDSNLARAEYQVRNPGSSSFSTMDTDYVQIQGNPWGAHAWSTSFSASGTGAVRFKCIDANGDSHATEWSVTVQAASNTYPTAQRVSPASLSVTVEAGQSQSFRGQCGNPDSNLDRAEYSRRNPGSSSYSLMDTDDVQYQAHPWGAHDWSTTFSTAGSGAVRFTCIDQNGDSHSTEWDVTVQQAPVAGNAAPSIWRDHPGAPSVAVDVGENLDFQVSCEDPNADQDLSVHWRKRQGGTLVEERENDWDLVGSEGNDEETFGFSAAGPYQVEAWCSDDGQPSESSPAIVWAVEVAGGGGENAAPVIGRVAPKATRFTLEPGDERDFEVECTDEDGGDLMVQWRLYRGSGLTESRDNDWDIAGGEGDDAEEFDFPEVGDYRLDVWCLDEHGATSATRSWSVQVEEAPANRPPTIERGSPDEPRLKLKAGDRQEFEVECMDPDEGQDVQTFWEVLRDGRREDSFTNDVSLWGNQGDDAEELEFEWAGTYRVEVTCVDDVDDASPPLAWEIIVTSIESDEETDDRETEDAMEDAESGDFPVLEFAEPETGFHEIELGDGFDVKVECEPGSSGDAPHVAFLFHGEEVERDVDHRGFSRNHVFAAPASVGTYGFAARCENPDGTYGPDATAEWVVEVVYPESGDWKPAEEIVARPPTYVSEGRVAYYLLHGICDTHELWTKGNGREIHESLLAETPYVWAPDYGPPKHANPQQMRGFLEDDLAARVSGAPSVDEVVIVGHSNGGLLARWMMLDFEAGEAGSDGDADLGSASISRAVTLDSPDRGHDLADACSLLPWSSQQHWQRYNDRYLETLFGSPPDWLTDAKFEAQHDDPSVIRVVFFECIHLVGQAAMHSCSLGLVGKEFLDGILLDGVAALGHFVAQPNLGAAWQKAALASMCEPGAAVAHLKPGERDDSLLTILHTEGIAIHHDVITAIAQRGLDFIRDAPDGSDCLRVEATEKGAMGPTIQAAQGGRGVEVWVREAGAFQVRSTSSARELDFTLDSPTHEGKTVVVKVDAGLGNPMGLYRVWLDGLRVGLASGYADILDPFDDGGQPEYLVLHGFDGQEILVSVPHFSTRTLRIEPEEPFVTATAQPEPGKRDTTPGAPLALALAVLLVAVAAARRRR